MVKCFEETRKGHIIKGLKWEGYRKAFEKRRAELKLGLHETAIHTKVDGPRVPGRGK